MNHTNLKGMAAVFLFHLGMLFVLHSRDVFPQGP